MATNTHYLSTKLRFSFSICNPIVQYSQNLVTRFPQRHSRDVSASAGITTSRTTTSFTWNDVVRTSQSEYVPIDSFGLSKKIKLCNRGYEMRSDFIPFVMEGQIIGYIHNGFAVCLREFRDVFTFVRGNSYGGSLDGYITVNQVLKSPEDRTRAVGDVIKFLGEKELIQGLRNELFPVKSSFGAPVLFSLERAAASYFGIKTYGIHMNGYVERDGQKFLWLGKRSQLKQIYPGMLDPLVAGGLPVGISCGENLMKECEEEAGIPRSISNSAISVGVVSYADIGGYSYKRDVVFCYDLRLTDDFVPKNQDGEVESFKLMPVRNVANLIRRTDFFKPNGTLGIIDFLFRHGFITPDNFGYLNLLQSLRRGDCF